MEIPIFQFDVTSALERKREKELYICLVQFCYLEEYISKIADDSVKTE